MITSRFSPERPTVSAYSRCSGVSSVSSSSSVMPITPFIGVRISWLMFARNSLFARFADSATCMARLVASSARSRSSSDRVRSSSARRSWAALHQTRATKRTMVTMTMSATPISDL